MENGCECSRRTDNRACQFCISTRDKYHAKLIAEARADLMKPRPLFGKIDLKLEVNFNKPAPISDFFLDLKKKAEPAAPIQKKAEPAGQLLIPVVKKMKKRKNYKPPVLNQQEKNLSELVEKKQMSIREYLDTIAPMEEEDE